MITNYITKHTSNCAKSACIRNINICFSNVCMQVKLVNILTYFPILSYKNGINTPIIQFGTR